MDISVITVSWNSKNFISEQIRSVQAGCHTVSCEEIVIDNGSSDGTLDLLKSEFPGMQVIANVENKGFGAANMQGVNISKGRYFLFLNPDMRVQAGSLDRIVTWMDEHADTGIASVKLTNEDGNVNMEATPRRFPKLWEQLALILKLPHIYPGMLSTYEMRYFDGDKEQEVDSVRGSFMLMRRDIVEKLGWAWDPRYYFWYEDVDICREVKRLGFKVMYTPIISCVDYVGQSLKKRATLWKQKQFTASMLLYWKKWEPWYKWMWIWALRPVGIGLARMDDFLRKGIKN